MNKKVKLLIAISCLLNFVLIGMIAGNMYHGFHKKHHKHMVHDKILKFIDEAHLEDALKASFKAQFNNLMLQKPHKDEMQKDREALVAIIIADPFDAKAFKEKVEEKHQYFESHRQKMDDVMIEFLGSLDSNDRQKLGKILSEN